jgi:glucose-6-phosphate isomerase
VKPITIDFSKTPPSVRPREVAELLEKNRAPIRNALSPIRGKTDSLGWVDVDTLADRELLTLIEDKAKEIRENAEAFVLIGVGGSNQGARAAVEALGDNRVEILYTGNTLSPASLNKTMAQLKGKSVYVNVIAKNFATLEPGATFRVIRHYLEEEYGLQEAAKRTIASVKPIPANVP